MMPWRPNIPQVPGEHGMLEVVEKQIDDVTEFAYMAPFFAARIRIINSSETSVKRLPFL
jgi:hypothetical protein